MTVEEAKGHVAAAPVGSARLGEAEPDRAKLYRRTGERENAAQSNPRRRRGQRKERAERKCTGPLDPEAEKRVSKKPSNLFG